MIASDRTLTTSLPLRRGSEGFNTSQDYLVKGLIPAGALCSIYGPGGSFKSFLRYRWRATLPAVRHGAEGESIKGLCCLSPEKEEPVYRGGSAPGNSALMTRWRSITCFASTARSFQSLREASNRLSWRRRTLRT